MSISRIHISGLSHIVYSFIDRAVQRFYLSGGKPPQCAVFTLVLSALVLVFIGTGLPVFAEHVFLKDGTIIHGRILQEGQTSVTIRGDDNKNRTVLRNTILRINYSAQTINKVYVQKRDGTSVVAYLVEQNQTEYIFRLDIDKPDEITISRSDVLFIAEKNPSGLKGDAGIDSVKLSWFPPYDQVSEYRVFIKTGSADQYTHTGSTASKSITLTGLKSNTMYFIIIRSVDTSGYESSPSNEIKITTGNIPPNPPVLVPAEKTPDGKFSLSWHSATDPDGLIRGYRIYHVDESGGKVIADLKETRLTLSSSDTNGSLFIVSYDDHNGESPRKKIMLPGVRSFQAGFTPVVIYPLGHFGKIAKPGFGSLLSFRVSGFNSPGIDAGIEAGCIFMRGKRADDGMRGSDSVLMIPGLCVISRTFAVSDTFSLTPEISLGAAYLRIRYTGLNSITLDRERRTNTAVDPVFRAGCAGSYSAWYRLTLLAKICAGVIPSDGEKMIFISAEAGISYQL